MSLRFLRGDAKAPKGHAIFVARSASAPAKVFCTYCVVAPVQLSLTKYLPSFLSAQLPAEVLQEASHLSVMPIPPLLEEGPGLEHLRVLAEHRDDDLCELGRVPSGEGGMEMMALVAEGCQEYGQCYARYAESFPLARAAAEKELAPLDAQDADELLYRSMSDRQKLTEIGKMVGGARYALGGQDSRQLQELRPRMECLTRLLPEKFRGAQLLAAVFEPGARGEKLAGLLLSRGFKLLDEEYGQIPQIEKDIRDLN